LVAIWYISWPFGIFSFQWNISWIFGIFSFNLVYFVAILNILWPFGIFCGHLVYFVAFWYILWPFGLTYGHLVYFVAIWYISWPFGIFSFHLVYFVAIWYILWSIGILFPVLVYCIQKNLATLLSTRHGSRCHGRVESWRRMVMGQTSVGLLHQGCQMVSFQTKNPNLVKFWRALDREMFIYFMAIWNVL
jgi:hypothetical protein